MTESLEILTEVWEWHFWSQQSTGFNKHLEVNLFQCCQRFSNKIPIPVAGHDWKQRSHLSNIRFNCSTCRHFCCLWIQVLQARPMDVQWQINSFLPRINIPHCHYDRPDCKSCLILSHLNLILFIYACEGGKVTQCFQKCYDVCGGNSIRGKCWVLLLKPLKRERIWEKSFLWSFSLFPGHPYS